MAPNEIYSERFSYSFLPSFSLFFSFLLLSPIFPSFWFTLILSSIFPFFGHWEYACANHEVERQGKANKSTTPRTAPFRGKKKSCPGWDSTLPRHSSMHYRHLLAMRKSNFASLPTYMNFNQLQILRKARFTIWRIAASRPAAKMEMESILATRQRGMARRGNATYSELSLSVIAHHTLIRNLI